MPLLTVIQRVESANLLIDNNDKWVSIGKGVIFYVCFIKDTKEDDLEKIVKTLVTTKLYVDPETGKPCSVQQTPCDILIIPQASLAGKIKQKSVQYHSLVEKQLGEKLYNKFVELVKQNKHEKSKVEAGVYGNRQGLKIISNGPYSHMLEIK